MIVRFPRRRARQILQQEFAKDPADFIVSASVQEPDISLAIIPRIPDVAGTRPEPIGLCIVRFVGRELEAAIVRAVVLEREFIAARAKYEVEAILALAPQLLKQRKNLKLVGTWYRIDADANAVRELQASGFTIEDTTRVPQALGSEEWKFVVLTRQKYNAREGRAGTS